MTENGNAEVIEEEVVADDIALQVYTKYPTALEIEERFAAVEKTFEMLDKIKLMCLKRLKASNITNQGGRSA